MRWILVAAPSALLVAAGPPGQDKRRELMTQESEIELGFLWNADDSNYFGDFTGLEDDGWYVLGNADIRHRTPWDDPDPWYLRLRGLNLGLDSREVFAEAKRPGRYGAFFEFDQIPKFWNEEGQIFFDKQGSSTFTLPAGWTALSGTELLGSRYCGACTGVNLFDPDPYGTLKSFLRDVDSRYLRRSFGGGISAVLTEDLDLSAEYEHLDRWGRYYTGAAFGTNGGNPRSVTLPERVDETTHTWETALAYAVDLFQLDLHYEGSRYVNHESRVVWQNPYDTGPYTTQNPGVVGYPTGFGQKHSPPDNWFNQVVGSGGYNLPWWNTRITGNAAFGWMTQDDNYLPFTVNPALAVTTGRPRSSLDGEIFTTFLNFQVNSRPIEDLRLDLRYRFDNRDNETPRDVYIYVQNDSADQTAIDSAEARRNRPYSYTRHNVDFEAGYTFLPRTELTLAYDWSQTHRDLQETRRVWENGVGAEVYSRYWTWMTARARYRHAWRDNSNYDGFKPQWAGWSAEHNATLDPATDFENHPLLRKYYQAAAETDAVGALFTFAPIETVGVGINVDWTHEDYDETDVGLVDRETFATGIDVSWSPIERLYAHAFYNYEKFTSAQNGWSWSGVNNYLDTNRRWQGKDKDRAHTVGTGFHLDLIPERLGLDTQYLFSYVQGFYGVNLIEGSALGDDFPYPNTRTRIHTVSARVDLAVTEQIGIRAGYLFERLTTRDWAIDDVRPTAFAEAGSCSGNACTFASGQQSPEATTHLVTWSIYYKFFW